MILSFGWNCPSHGRNILFRDCIKVNLSNMKVKFVVKIKKE